MSIDLDTLAARLAAMTPGPWRVGSVERWHIIVPYPESIAGPCGERVLLRANEHFPYGADLAGIADLRNAADELIRLARLAVPFEARQRRPHKPCDIKDCSVCFVCSCTDVEQLRNMVIEASEEADGLRMSLAEDEKLAALGEAYIAWVKASLPSAMATDDGLVESRRKADALDDAYRAATEGQ